jgi:signal transduction histidine kinase
MSYELRTPLTSITGFAEMLAQGMAGALEPQAQEYANAILSSSERLSTLVDNVLDLTQNEGGGLPMEHKKIDLAELVRRAGGACAGLISAKMIEFVVDIDPSVGSIKGDAKRLRQAVDHLLRNALTYTPDRGRVLLHAAGDETQALIVVSDNGPGMDETQQAQALDRFSRAGLARDGNSGAGLGLPLAQQFVEAHRGSMTLISEIGSGTAVKIELPRT